jgi:hypothetical protein
LGALMLAGLRLELALSGEIWHGADAFVFTVFFIL